MNNNSWKKQKLIIKIIRIIRLIAACYIAGSIFNWPKSIVITLCIIAFVFSIFILIDSNGRIPENYFEHCDN